MFYIASPILHQFIFKNSHTSSTLMSRVLYQIQVYGPYSQEPIRSFTRFRDTAYGGSFRGDGKLLVAGSEEGLIRLFDVSGRVALRQFTGHTKYVPG